MTPSLTPSVILSSRNTKDKVLTPTPRKIRLGTSRGHETHAVDSICVDAYTDRTHICKELHHVA